MSARGGPVAVEQWEGLEPAQHAVGLTRAERREPDLDVAEQLDRHAAGAAGDERAEGRIADRADDQLGAGRAIRWTWKPSTDVPAS